MNVSNVNLKKLVLTAGATVLLGILLTHSALVALAMLYLLGGIDVPVLIEKSFEDGATTISATPWLALLALGASALMTHHAAKSDGRFRIPQIVVIILAISIVLTIFGSIVACGVACPRFTCDGCVVSCEYEVLVAKVKYICKCCR